MYCWVILPFSDICCFFVSDLTHWLSFRASCTLFRLTFVWTRQLVVISTTCIHSCRMCILTVVCVYFLSLSDWYVCLRLSAHEYFNHATSFLLELLDNSVLQCPKCNPLENYWTDFFEQIRICLTQRRIIVLLRMYPSLYCYAVLECFSWH